MNKDTAMAQDLFTPSDDIYLLAHSIGKMPVSAKAYCEQHFFEIWQSNRADIWPMWLDQIEAFKQALAALYNGSAGEFCPQSNVSSGLSKLLGALPGKSGKNVIVMTENDFPSAGFVLKQAERLDFEIRVLSKDKDAQDIETWSAALSGDVACVFITHVHYNTNKLIPVADICRIARERDIVSVVDVAQSSGIVPIDLHQWQADVMVGSCIKWLCGGPGAGFLWVTPSLVQGLEPIDLGWFSHQNPFEFDINHFEYAVDSKRFWGGTPSVLPFVTATNSINTLLGIGIDQVRAHNRRLSEMICDAIPASAVVSPLDQNLKGGTTVLNFPNQDEIEQKLHAKRILFDTREYGIRLSPHIYTGMDEIETLLSCLS